MKKLYVTHVASGCYVRGWSPTHQQPIVVGNKKLAHNFGVWYSFEKWYAKQPGSSNYGAVTQFQVTAQ